MRGDKPTTETFPAGSLVVRMDQPYSRAADALLDRQFWAPDDPQKHPYDDTGWSFSHLFNLKVTRVVDPAILSAKMAVVDDPASLTGKVSGTGSVLAVGNTGQVSLLALVYKLKGNGVQVTEKAFDADGKHYAAGSLLITGADDGKVKGMLHDLALDGAYLSAAPTVAAHAATAPRVAIMHTWLSTQTEGWWRYAFDTAGVPYDYISTQTAAAEADLRGKYDVIVFAPVGYAGTETILNGIPRWNNVMPWQKTDMTPNFGHTDETADIRPGLGYGGLEHLKTFVEKGGLLITCEDTAQFAIDTGLAPGVTSGGRSDARVVGTILNTVFVDKNSPVAFGYGAGVPVISANGMTFSISSTLGGRGGRSLMDPYSERPTGRGSVDDSDTPTGRKITEPEKLEKQEPWEAKKLNEEEMRDNMNVIPEKLRPNVILRFADGKGLLLDGLLDKGSAIAEHPVVVDAHLGEGNVLLFGNNPVYRGETVGTYAMVFNAILNYQQLRDVPSVPAPKAPKAPEDAKDSGAVKGEE